QALQAQRRQAEQEPGHQAYRAGDRNRRPVRKARLVHEDRGDVRPYGIERAVAERNLSVEPGEDVQAEQGDRVDQDQRELEGAVFADEERQRAGRQQGNRDHEEVAIAHTRVTWTLPKKPEGRTVSTPMIST